VLNTVIPRNTDMRDAHMNRQDIFAYAAQSKSALAYEKLIHELFQL
jgi:chromosome partitioning protein